MSESQVDLILYNANILTLEQESPNAELIAIKGATIVGVGSNDDLDQFKGPDTKVIDCEGKTVIPGFNDAHCHPISMGVTMLYVNCSLPGVKNISDIQAQIRQRAEITPGEKWVRAAQYNELDLAEQRHPTCWELDEAAPNNPVMMVHASGSSCVLNSKALQLLCITRDTPDQPGGQIGRDPNTGEPNGVILGRNELVEKGVTPPDPQEILEGIKLANKEFISHGITSLQDTTWANSLRHWNFLKSLKESGNLIPRITMIAGTDAVPELQANRLRTVSGTTQLRMGAAKIALDESTGNPHPPQDDINQHALRAHQAGFQLSFHVSDTINLLSTLAALEFVGQADNKPYLRPRLEHCPICPPGSPQSIGAFDAIVVTQPAFLYYNGERYCKDIEQKQMGWLYPTGSFHRRGIKAAISSDSPMVPCNPFVGLYVMVTRKEQSGQVIAKEQCIPVLAALKMYIEAPAYTSFEESLKGTIAPHKLADLAVLSADPTKVDPEEILNIKVAMTIVDGKVVWEG